MTNTFLKQKSIIGMIHVDALPGTPGNHLSVQDIVSNACSEAEIYLRHDIDAIMIENMHDVPYLKETAGPEIVASMTAVAIALRKMTDKPLGIQILAAANKAALAVAQSANFQFIRVEGFVYGHLADEGYIESCAGELLRYRKQIGAENIAILTDVKKKHSSHSITQDISLEETVKTTEYFRSDGIIVTGTSTGEAALIDDVKTAKVATKLPVLVGSGITAENIEQYWPYAYAFIVGSNFKENGDWRRPVNEAKVVEFLTKLDMIRK